MPSEQVQGIPGMAYKGIIRADRLATYVCVCVCVHSARSDMRVTCVMSFRTLTRIYLTHLRENKGYGTETSTVVWRGDISSVFAQFRKPSFQIVCIRATFSSVDALWYCGKSNGWEMCSYNKTLAPLCLLSGDLYDE